MRVTTDPGYLSRLYELTEWRSPDSFMGRCEDLVRRVAEQMSLLQSAKPNISYLWTPNPDCYSPDFLSGSVVYGDNIRFGYYRFPNDDKYFLDCGNDLYYQESDAYIADYALFPSLASAQRIEYCMPTIDSGRPPLILMSRHQYGHFLYDDLIPVLSYLTANAHKHSCVVLMQSCTWQVRAAKQLMRILEIQVPLLTLALPQTSSLLEFSYSSFLLPHYPASLLSCFDRLRSLDIKPSGHDRWLHDEASKKRLVYLSRDRFDNASPRVVNRDQVIGCILNNKHASHIRPQDHTESQLLSIVHQAEVIVAEPGTLPLIAGVFSSCSSRILILLSSRCISACSPAFVYSGWRYHTPFAQQSEYIYCKPRACHTNPFSDTVYVPLEWLESRIRAMQ